MRKILPPFFGSALLHGGILALLIWAASAPTTPDLSEFELVTLSPPSSLPVLGASSVPRKKAAPAPKPPAPEDRPEAAAEIPAEPVPPVPNEDSGSEALTGETDLGSELTGRAPRNESERYLAGLRERIARQQVYPKPSRVFQEEGTVKLRLTLDRSGALLKVELAEASKFQRLNDAALRAATKASPFPAFPSEVRYATWRILLPIRFTLATN